MDELRGRHETVHQILYIGNGFVDMLQVEDTQATEDAGAPWNDRPLKPKRVQTIRLTRKQVNRENCAPIRSVCDRDLLQQRGRLCEWLEETVIGPNHERGRAPTF